MAGLNLFEELTRDLQEVDSSALQAKDDFQESKFMNLLIEIRAKKQKEVSLLGTIIDSFLQEDKAQIYKNIKSFLSMSEKHFLEAKPLCYYEREVIQKETEPEDNHFEKFGTSDYFPSKFEKMAEGHYCFTLPPMLNKYNSEKNAIDGKRMQYLLVHLMQDFEETEKIDRLHKPVAVFEHFVDTSAGYRWVPDADNLDMKVALDSVQGFLISNDSLLDIWLMQIGRESDTAYTKLHFIEDYLYPAWTIENTM